MTALISSLEKKLIFYIGVHTLVSRWLHFN